MQMPGLSPKNGMFEYDIDLAQIPKDLLGQLSTLEGVRRGIKSPIEQVIARLYRD